MVRLAWWAIVCLTSVAAFDAASASQESRKLVLLAGQVSSQTDLDEPPYDVVLTLKMKLQRVGVRVTLAPTDGPDTVLVVTYRERPGRAYRLEHGTHIFCRLAIHDAARGPAAPPVHAYEIEAETSWPSPHGSPYWDAVGHLEENAFYYYIGELVRGWVDDGSDLVSVFGRVLMEPALAVTMDGGDDVLTAHVAANRAARVGAIRELGRHADPRALPALWHVVDTGEGLERLEAVRSIGDIGALEAGTRLRAIAGNDRDGQVREAAAEAGRRLERRP